MPSVDAFNHIGFETFQLFCGFAGFQVYGRNFSKRHFATKLPHAPHHDDQRRPVPAAAPGSTEGTITHDAPQGRYQPF